MHLAHVSGFTMTEVRVRVFCRTKWWCTAEVSNSDGIGRARVGVAVAEDQEPDARLDGGRRSPRRSPRAAVQGFGPRLTS